MRRPWRAGKELDVRVGRRTNFGYKVAACANLDHSLRDEPRPPTIRYGSPLGRLSLLASFEWV